MSLCRCLFLSMPFFLSSVAMAVDAPVFVPGESSSATNLEVLIHCPTAGATIHYTLSGTEPTIYDTAIVPNSVISVRRNSTLSAKAWVGTAFSPTATADFSITGDISAGSLHALALNSSGGLYAWGSQLNGRLGNGVVTNVNLATLTRSGRAAGNLVEDAVAIAAGANHSVMLDKAGNPWCFGFGTYGELGNNANAHQSYAVRVVKSAASSVPGGPSDDWLTGCIGVAAGQYFSAAVGSNGKVYTWGNQGNARLGNGTTSGNRFYAGPVMTSSSNELTGISAVDLGDLHGIAKATDGRVWVWGNNANGQLGIGTIGGNQTYATKAKLSTSPDTDLTDAWDISTSDVSSSIVRWKGGDPDLQGSVWTFGNQWYGRLGNGLTTNANIVAPVRVKIDSSTYLDHVVQVSTSALHTLAVDTEGHVWAWGYNGYGALGNNTTTNSGYAVKVQTLSPVTGLPVTLSNIVRVAAGGSPTDNFSLALAADGTIYAWGQNSSGQMGTGTVSTGANRLAVPITSQKMLPNSPDIVLLKSMLYPNEPGTVTLSASVTDADGPADIQKVDFYSRMVAAMPGDLPSYSIATPPWSVTMTGLLEGIYYNYAVVTDQSGNTAYSLPVTFAINPTDPTDTDGDGLPDAWEMMYFGSLAYDAAGDYDNDGISNGDELSMGTNPAVAGLTNEASYESYEYDPLDRLLNVNGAHSRSYVLDPAGNIESAQ